MDVCGLGVLCCLRRYQTPRYDREVNEVQVQLDTTQMGMKIAFNLLKINSNSTEFIKYSWTL